MSMLRFRNVDADPGDPVATWPYEALVTAVERGGLSDWRRIVAELRRDPWGQVARDLENHLSYAEPHGVTRMMARALERARDAARDDERAEVAERVRALVTGSGLSRAEFARRSGTSQSRLSTYCSGSVTPSAALMVRFERIAGGAR